MVEKYKLVCEKREDEQLPEIFPPLMGVGMEVEHEGQPYVSHPCNKQGIREVTISIMTYKGVAANASHYYVSIDYLPLYLKDPNSMRHRLPSYEKSLPKEMWGWDLKIHRKITPDELKTERFNFFNNVEEQFQYTDALNSWEEIIEALELFLPKFDGCIIRIDCYSASLKKIIVEKL